MNEPLRLLEVEPLPRLTAQQQLALERLRQAGADGLSADEVGALAHSVMESRWRHPEGERCVYCGQRGLQLLRALRAKGLVRYRARLKRWQAVGVPQVEVPLDMRTEEEIYGF